MEHFRTESVWHSEISSENRILAIDDDEGFRDFLGAFLAKFECRWIITGDMSGFKRAYQALEPTVVLTDMFMPGADGFDVMRWLAEQGFAARVVLVSGSSSIFSDMAKKLGSAHGLTDVTTLQKPMHLTDLSAALGLS